MTLKRELKTARSSEPLNVSLAGGETKPHKQKNAQDYK